MIPPTAAPSGFPLAATFGVCTGGGADPPAAVATSAAVVPAPVGPSPISRSAAPLPDPSPAVEVLPAPAAALVLSGAVLVLASAFVVVVETTLFAAPPVGTGYGPVYSPCGRRGGCRRR